MDVVVTGAAGFIGAALVRALVARGDAVHAFVHPRTDMWRLAGVEGLELHRVDVTDPGEVGARLRGLDPFTVINAAARGGHAGPGGGAARAEMWQDTVIGTVALLDALDGTTVQRLVHLGSSLVYAPSSRPLRESDPCRPMTARGAAKLASAVAVEQWGAECGVPTVDLRIFRAYGKGEPAGRLVPTILESLRTGDAIPTPAASTRRDMIHVDDVVEACLRCASADVVAPGALNVGFGRAHTVDEVLQVFEDVAGRTLARAPGGRPLARHDVEHWQADLTRTSEVLGWRPAIDLRRGVELVLEGV